MIFGIRIPIKYCYILSFLLVYAYVFFHGNFLLSFRTFPDQGCFQSIAHHMLHGKILYKDIFDHKPPGIFLLDALLLKIGGGNILAVRIFDGIFLLGFCVLFFYISKQYIKNLLLHFSCNFIHWILFLRMEYFACGNYTEIYGIFLNLLAFFMVMKHKENLRLLHCFWIGFFITLSCWIKEPFVFSALGVFIAVVYVSFKHHALKKIAFLTLGAASISGFFLAFLFITGAWNGFLEQLDFSLVYTGQHLKTKWQLFTENCIRIRKVFNYTFLSAGLTFGISLIYLIFETVKLKNKNGILLFIQFACIFLSFVFIDYVFDHYFFQLIGIFILCVFYTLDSLLYNAKKYLQKMGEYVYYMPSIIIAIISLFHFSSMINKNEFACLIKPQLTDNITNYINKEKNSNRQMQIFAKRMCGYYMLTHSTSPCRYANPFPFQWLNTKYSSGLQKVAHDSAILINANLPYLLSDKQGIDDFYYSCGIKLWIYKNYYPVAIEPYTFGDTAVLLKKIDPHKNTYFKYDSTAVYHLPMALKKVYPEVEFLK